MPYDFTVQIAHSVQEFDPDTWDQLGKAQLFSSHRWYHFAETVLADDLPIYVTLARRGEPVARGTFWLKRREYLPISAGPVRQAIQALLRHRPLLVCRTPLASSTGLILPPEQPLRDAAIETLARIALEIGQQHKASFILFDYLSPAETASAGWPRAYIPYRFTEPGTRLVIRWPDFDSYLKQLSKSVTKDYRRHCNRAADLGIRTCVHSTINTELSQALRLIRNVERHHRSAPNFTARRVLENAHLVESTWLTAQTGDRLAGCGLMLGDGQAKVLALLGLDYEVRYAYFQLLYAAIRHAIEAGARILRGGGGAYEAKQRLGFQLEEQNHVMFTTRNPILRHLGRWLPIS